MNITDVHEHAVYDVLAPPVSCHGSYSVICTCTHTHTHTHTHTYTPPPHTHTQTHTHIYSAHMHTYRDSTHMDILSTHMHIWTQHIVQSGPQTGREAGTTVHISRHNCAYQQVLPWSHFLQQKERSGRYLPNRSSSDPN